MTESPPATPAWTVTQQTEVTDQGATGGYVPGVRVTFRTRAGVTGSVFVEHTDYTLDRVRAAIAARAAILDGVAALEG